MRDKALPGPSSSAATAPLSMQAPQTAGPIHGLADLPCQHFLLGCDAAHGLGIAAAQHLHARGGQPHVMHGQGAREPRGGLAQQGCGKERRPAGAPPAGRLLRQPGARWRIAPRPGRRSRSGPRRSRWRSRRRRPPVIGRSAASRRPMTANRPPWVAPTASMKLARWAARASTASGASMPAHPHAANSPHAVSRDHHTAGPRIAQCRPRGQGLRATAAVARRDCRRAYRPAPCERSPRGRRRQSRATRGRKWLALRAPAQSHRTCRDAARLARRTGWRPAALSWTVFHVTQE